MEACDHRQFDTMFPVCWECRQRYADFLLTAQMDYFVTRLAEDETVLPHDVAAWMAALRAEHGVFAW